MIQFNTVEIGYKQALLTINKLELKSGEVYALIGSNGSGKSTLLNTILKKTHVLTGDVYLNSTVLASYSVTDLAKTIAFVDSKFDGIEHLSVVDYVALGRTPFTNALGRLHTEDHAIIDAAIEKLNLGTFRNRETLKLSDGERQMVSIARAICQSTPIILLDEPTAFLDYGNRKKLIETLSGIARAENKCVLFSTHDIDICLEEKGINLLVINQSKKELEMYANTISKSEIISIGFDLSKE
jgi:iron complex transport system ATP-binding protein